MQRLTGIPLVKRPVGRVHSGGERPLIMPHPLDFDWRFTLDLGNDWRPYKPTSRYSAARNALLGVG